MVYFIIWVEIFRPLWFIIMKRQNFMIKNKEFFRLFCRSKLCSPLQITIIELALMKCVSLAKNIGIFYMQKAIFSRHKKNPHYYAGFNRKSGRGWIRTIEVKEQQIYSLPPLATRELSHIKFKWSWWTDSNPRPADYKSAALPTELHQHSDKNYYIIVL